METISSLRAIRYHPRCIRGHTMTNLLTTVAVAGVVTGGMPAMQNFVHEQRLVAQVHQLFGDLQLARSESIKRGAPVVLCKSSDGATCSAATEWQSGWLLFVDVDDDRTVDANEPVIRVQQSLSTGMTLRFGTSYRYVYYKPDGTAWPNATFTFCDPRGAPNARAIIVSNAGRARISNKSSSDGVLSCS